MANSLLAFQPPALKTNPFPPNRSVARKPSVILTGVRAARAPTRSLTTESLHSGRSTANWPACAVKSASPKFSDCPQLTVTEWVVSAKAIHPFFWSASPAASQPTPPACNQVVMRLPCPLRTNRLWHRPRPTSKRSYNRISTSSAPSCLKCLRSTSVP